MECGVHEAIVVFARPRLSGWSNRDGLRQARTIPARTQEWPQIAQCGVHSRNVGKSVLSRLRFFCLVTPDGLDGPRRFWTVFDSKLLDGLWIPSGGAVLWVYTWYSHLGGPEMAGLWTGYGLLNATLICCICTEGSYTVIPMYATGPCRRSLGFVALELSDFVALSAISEPQPLSSLLHSGCFPF